MHGVGFETMKIALNMAGYMNINPVEKQVHPTLSFLPLHSRIRKKKVQWI